MSSMDVDVSATTVPVMGSGDAVVPGIPSSSTAGQTCTVHATAAADACDTHSCRSLLPRAPRALTPSVNGAYLLCARQWCDD